MEGRRQQWQVRDRHPDEVSPSATVKPQIGINGLHLFKGYLYWTNSDANTLYRTKVD
jgi:hypothetical protein